jgi:hypothetical protein
MASSRHHRFVVAAGTSAIVALVAASPWLMRWVFPADDSWTQLSDFGQAYGAASAVLSALALCGIAYSLLLQSMQTRTSQIYALSQRQLDLVRFTLEHPEFAYSWGESPHAENYALRSFSNLIVTHWLMLWRVGDIDEPSLRAMASRFFRGSVARAFWEEIGPRWIRNPLQRDRLFLRILDDALHDAERTGPAQYDPQSSAVLQSIERHQQGTRAIAALSLAAGLVGGAIMGAWIARRGGAT